MNQSQLSILRLPLLSFLWRRRGDSLTITVVEAALLDIAWCITFTIAAPALPTRQRTPRLVRLGIVAITPVVVTLLSPARLVASAIADPLPEAIVLSVVGVPPTLWRAAFAGIKTAVLLVTCGVTHVVLQHLKCASLSAALAVAAVEVAAFRQAERVTRAIAEPAKSAALRTLTPAVARVLVACIRIALRIAHKVSQLLVRTIAGTVVEGKQRLTYGVAVQSVKITLLHVARLIAAPIVDHRRLLTKFFRAAVRRTPTFAVSLIVATRLNSTRSIAPPVPDPVVRTLDRTVRVWR
mmetsp:Transcript_13200/g.31503  ORF Transcript_13200/g.31503 Transcript_13200/m.31503 type:complete len:295 (+) Transcript_13200:333-1217(+)